MDLRWLAFSKMGKSIWNQAQERGFMIVVARLLLRRPQRHGPPRHPAAQAGRHLQLQRPPKHPRPQYRVILRRGSDQVLGRDICPRGPEERGEAGPGRRPAHPGHS